MRIGKRHLMVVCWLSIEAAVDLFARRTVKIPNLETKARGLDQGLGEGGDADVVGFTLRGLDVVAAVRLDVAHGDEVPEVVCMRLHPGTGEKLRGLADMAAGERACVLTLT